MSRNWHASKSNDVMLKDVQKANHSKNPSSFSDSKQFVCSTCQKCVFNANHDPCITKFLNEVNSQAKVQSYKIRNSNKPIEPKCHSQKADRKIITGHNFSPNKSFAVYEKTSPRSCLSWKPTGIIFNIVGLRWVPTGKIFTYSTTKYKLDFAQIILFIVIGSLIVSVDLSRLAITLNRNQAKEVDNNSKELKEKIEALNEELVIERQTRGAAEATLEHLRAENTKADAKSQELEAKLAKELRRSLEPKENAIETLQQSLLEKEQGYLCLILYGVDTIRFEDTRSCDYIETTGCYNLFGISKSTTTTGFVDVKCYLNTRLNAPSSWLVLPLEISVASLFVNAADDASNSILLAASFV
uniref:Protein GRIP n=1 Tax=Tanacetum cinerariifolium TaxID=118510 RepID=A0A6L2KF62_TANCI|nr:protein GRIP [Tanacetum cinerariifolium]